ncbi:transposase [Abditibacterium utsteinense]
MFYVLRTGCQWRYLPQNYPKWSSVDSCFRRWSRNGIRPEGTRTKWSRP